MCQNHGNTLKLWDLRGCGLIAEYYVSIIEWIPCQLGTAGRWGGLLPVNLDKCSPFNSGWQWHNQPFSIVLPKNLGHQIRSSHLFTPKYIFMSGCLLLPSQKIVWFLYFPEFYWGQTGAKASICHGLNWWWQTLVSWKVLTPGPLMVACGEKAFLIIYRVVFLTGLP